jgi:hypothetical protein
MRRALAIVVFLTVILPVYGQEKSAQTASNQSNTDPTKQPPPKPTAEIKCEVKQDGTAIECKWAETKSESYLRRLFSPENTPNIGLFFVGLLGVTAAIFTLKMIKSQVDTFVSKERARITVDIEPLKPNGREEPRGIPYDKSPMLPASGEIWHADLLIANSGETNAFVGAALCKAYVKATGWNPQEEIFNSSIGLPKVMHPHTDPFTYQVRIETGNILRPEMDREMVKAVADGSMGIFVIGHIEFVDVFDSRWTMKFCRKWGAWWFGGAWQGVNIWYDYPDDILPEDNLVNGEFRIKRPSWLQRLRSRMRGKDPDFPMVEIVDEQ